jgi:PIN domain nuclease of toxin-antitoxin system
MLVDTHVALWVLADDPQLGARARKALRSQGRVLLSAATVWEIAIKADLGKLEAPDDLLERVRSAGFAPLPVSAEHTWATRRVGGLPHRDPFDRLLLAQSIVERVPFLTADRVLLGATLDPAVDLIDARE